MSNLFSLFRRNYKPIVFVLTFTVIGTALILISKAATNSVSFSGTIYSSSPTISQTVSPTASGNMDVTVSYQLKRMQSMKVSIIGNGGTTLATKTSTTSPISLGTSVTSAPYTVVMQAIGMTRSTATYTIAVTLPIPDAVSLTPPPAPAPAPAPSSTIWAPAVKTSFMWLLSHPLDINNAADMGTGTKDYLGNAAPDPQVYDIDGFDNPATTVTALHDRSKKVVCYISAGSYENWRSDASTFPTSVLGNSLTGWAGERWLDVRQVGTLQTIMGKRLDMCKSKGFDAVEFDNVDGYTNSTGFPLVSSDQLTYNTMLASEAHTRGLSAALKNDINQLSQLAPVFDFAINEQCNQYNECGGYTSFVNNNKAVFNIEYQALPSSFCPAMNTASINAYKMPLNLDGGRVTCR